MSDDRIDEFRLVRVLGRGGMGTVYLGHDTILERDVAIKLLRYRGVDEDVRLRFLTEARAIARLAHPNVVAIFRASMLRDGHPYLVQELVRGHSLDRIDHPVDPRRVLELAIGIGRGLAAAHRRGILHRDIKPANVMVTDEGVPKLLDFGLAKLAASRESTPEAPRSLKPPSALLDETADPAPQRAVDAPNAVREAPLADEPALEPPRTSDGVVLGTPRYMAPEIWRGEPATARSDLYSFGALLYELATGSAPHREADRAGLERLVVTDAPIPSLAELRSELDPELAAAVMACLSHEPARRPASADELVHRLERAWIAAPPLPEGNPYPGLAPFSAEHRAVFYGRSADVSAIVDRLRGEPLVVVAGDSGIGKSSLCRAGVIPAVIAGAIGGVRTWDVRTISVGRHAVAALRDALGLDDGADATPSRVGATSRAGVLVFIDQLEELVTLHEPAEAEAAAEIIASLAADLPGVKVLVAVRGDFLTRVAALPALGPLMSRSLHLLRVLSLADARDAVVGPARAKGTRFETDDLVETLASSIAGQPGALPLLSFALAELWQRRDVARGVISTAALDAIGGVTGGLARHADAVVGALGPAERAAARRVVLQLVSSNGTRATRNRTELGPDADPATEAALETMIHGRLVVAHNAASGEPVYELAHDSLIAAWATLRGWLDDAAGQRGLRLRLAVAANEWHRLGRPRDALWSRAQLAEAAALDEVSALDRAFLGASRARIRRGRAILVAVAVSLPAVALATGLVLRSRDRAARDREVATHMERAEIAVANAERARRAAEPERREALRLFDENATARAEPSWKRAHASADAAARAYTAATAELEAALFIDGSRLDVRARMARTMYDHALAAEVDGDAATAGKLLAKLAPFDDGTLVAAWNKPASLTVHAPRATQITLRRYGERDGELVLGGPIASIASNASSRLTRELAPGSYLVELSGADGARLAYPVALARSETYEVTVPMPRAADIPANMIYVAAGRFLVGSDGDDLFRKEFLSDAPPVHQVWTRAYLIGRTEVTFAEWLEYLRALPPLERARRQQRGAPGTGQTARLDGGGAPGEPYTLTIQPVSHAYRAREGEPLVVLARRLRGLLRWDARTRDVLRWESLPAGGISFHDARAYAAWLSSSGRLAGARLCTDHEWERAARGADGRRWAHGDRVEPDDANIDVTYDRISEAMGPDEVGAHPRLNSPFGVADTIGNVWEWVEGPGGTALVRGGGWYHGSISALAANRDFSDPTLRALWAGVRICADVV